MTPTPTVSGRTRRDGNKVTWNILGSSTGRGVLKSWRRVREGLTKATDSGRAGEWAEDVFALNAVSLGDLFLMNIDVCIDTCTIASYLCRTGEDMPYIMESNIAYLSGALSNPSSQLLPPCNF